MSSGESTRALLTEEEEAPSEQAGPKQTPITSEPPEEAVPGGDPAATVSLAFRLHRHRADSVGDRSSMGQEALHGHQVTLRDLFLSCLFDFNTREKLLHFQGQTSFPRKPCYYFIYTDQPTVIELQPKDDT